MLVFSGAVLINGLAAEPGARVNEAKDRVEVNGVRIALKKKQPCCLILNKPVRVLSTARDPEGRRTVLDLVPESLRRGRRLYPVGRLDYFSEGLILLTDDGALTQRLVHPRHHVAKTYRVLVRGQVTAAALRTMRGGMTLAEGERLAPVAVKVLDEREGQTNLEMTLRQGINRQIRRMLRDLGLTVLRLVRVAQGPLVLGSLPVGAVRPLSSGELRALRREVGLADQSQTRADHSSETTRRGVPKVL